jgi:protein SCO1/2
MIVLNPVIFLMRWLGIIFLWLFICTSINAAELKSGVFEPPRAAPDFALQGSHGQLFKLSEMRSKLVILGFGFSHCPEICPTTLANLSRVMKNLGDDAKDVQVVYITVDPERDTVARLQEYMAIFNPGFIGLTGSAEELSAIRREYGILIERELHKDGNYEVHHSSYLYLIDRQGLLRALVPYGKTVADITHDLQILLREPPPTKAL